jgi:glycosyltransferase involved in cell wall biosynthesis
MAIKKDSGTMIDKQVIFVLGMHRTGSSAIARVLSLCGASLPRMLLGPNNESNPTGHWEPLEALQLNDDFLHRHGATWFDPTLRLQGEIVFEEEERDIYIERIRAFLEMYAGKPLLVIKDPRITAVSDFWFEGAARAGFAVKVVMPVRHPGEVSASLAVRDRVSFEFANALWLKYNLLAERRSRGLPRVFVEYPSLLNDWRYEVARISEALSVDLSAPDSARIDEFLRKELHRQRSNGQPTEAFGEPWIGQVYAELSAAARNGSCDPHVMDRIFSAYRACERAFRISLQEFLSWTNSFSGFQRWFGGSLPAEVQAELERLRGAEATAQEQRPGFAKAVADAEAARGEATALRTAVQAAQDEASALRTAVQAAQDEASALRTAVQAAQEEASALRTAVQAAQEEVACRDQRISQLLMETTAEAAANKEQVAHLSAELHRRQEQIAGLNRVLAEKKDRNIALYHGLNQKDGQLTALHRALADNQAAAEASNLRAEQLQHELGLVQASSAWRALQVIRKPLARYPQVRRWTGRAARVVWWTVTFQLPQRLSARRALFRVRDEIAASALFDSAWYSSQYPDVADAGWEPALHYALFGPSERRLNPGPQFDASWYLENNADVAKSGMNPLCHYLRYGVSEKRSIRAVGAPDPEPTPDPQPEESAAPSRDYGTWVEQYDTLTEEDKAAIRAHIATLTEQPLISVVMPVYNTKPLFLRRAIDSVLSQLYPTWELCIADDASSDPEIRRILEDYARRDRRIKVVFRPKNGHISAASNSALELATGEFVALMDHDDELAPHALYMVAVELNQHPDAEIMYSDEDQIDGIGRRHDPHFKPEWNPNLFYSYNIVNHLGIYRTSTIRAVNGFREGYEGSQDYDLALRVSECTTIDQIRHIPHVLYHWRIASDVETFSTQRLNTAVEAGRRALVEHFARRRETVTIVEGRKPYISRIVRQLPADPPLVSLIVATRDRVGLLRNCLDGLLHKTRYPKLEILVVDNDSQEPETLAYLDSVQSDHRVRILKIPGAFNFSLLNNQAVSLAAGEIVGFINNDIDVIHADWLEEMVCRVVQAGVGAVGAKLYFPDETIQHAGVVVGLGGVAGHGHKYFPRSALGYMCRLHVAHDVSCVTAACMVMPKAVFLEVGGFDGKNLPISFNDVDLCLKIRERGYSIIWTPYAELYHLESASRGSDADPENGRARQEEEHMKNLWGTDRNEDPFYSPNLTRDHEDYGLAFPPRVAKPWLCRAEDSEHVVESKRNHMTNALDNYVTSFPSHQNALDIFRGQWTSRLPAPWDSLTAGSTPLFEDPRIKWAIERLGGVNDKTILELGPLEGGHSYMLEAAGAKSVLAIEGNSNTFLRCLTVKEILGLQKVRFLCGDFRQFLSLDQRRFEVIFASGVLYHMTDPMQLLFDMLSRTDQLYLWTHYFDDSLVARRPNVSRRLGAGQHLELKGFSYELHNYIYDKAFEWAGFCGGSAPTAAWLTRDSILGAFRYFGFYDVTIGFDQGDHPNGPAFAIVARRR